MKNIFFLIGLVIIPSLLFAQPEYFAFEQGRFHDGYRVWVFPDSTFLYNQAGNAGDENIIKVLFRGDQLIIEAKQFATYSSNELISNWYKVNYEKNGTVLTGFVKGTDIALAGKELYNGGKKTLIMFRINGYLSSGAYQAEAVAVTNKKTICEITFECIDHPLNNRSLEHSFMLSKNIFSGLDSVSTVIAISYFHENDGYPFGTAYMIWNGTALVYVADAMNLAEPEIFRYNSKVIFPADPGGLEKSIRYREEVLEYDVSAGKYVVTQEREIRYQWTGEELLLVEDNDNPEK